MLADSKIILDLDDRRERFRRATTISVGSTITTDRSVHRTESARRYYNTF